MRSVLLLLTAWLTFGGLLAGCGNRVDVHGDGSEHGQAVGFRLPF